MSDFDLTHLSIHPTRELKRAYQELVLKFHPDKTGGKECEAFINVQVSDLETSMMDEKHCMVTGSHFILC